ncbi:MAG: hypothetical protein KTR23_11075 [Rhodospirillales bacterium]|nr:hypothetical protein [Rhodospirillales bacterium]
MKTVTADACDTRSFLPHGADRGFDKSPSPIGLGGHLLNALAAWRKERREQKLRDSVSLKDPQTLRDISMMTPAERYVAQRDAMGQFTQTGDVLSSMVLSWPGSRRRN